MIVLPYYAWIDISPPKGPPPGLTKAKVAAPLGPRPANQKKITVAAPTGPRPANQKKITVEVKKAKVLPPPGRPSSAQMTFRAKPVPVILAKPVVQFGGRLVGGDTSGRP